MYLSFLVGCNCWFMIFKLNFFWCYFKNCDVFLFFPFVWCFQHRTYSAWMMLLENRWSESLTKRPFFTLFLPAFISSFDGSRPKCQLRHSQRRRPLSPLVTFSALHMLCNLRCRWILCRFEQILAVWWPDCDQSAILEAKLLIEPSAFRSSNCM